MQSIKKYRLRKNRDFQRIYKRGRSISCKHIVLMLINSSDLKIGFCVGKKVGNSVTRNRVKRLMREAFRKLLPNVKNARLVLIARKPAAEAGYFEIAKSVENMLFKAGLMNGVEK